MGDEFIPEGLDMELELLVKIVSPLTRAAVVRLGPVVTSRLRFSNTLSINELEPRDEVVTLL